MIEFQLFRFKVFQPVNYSLFENQREPSKILTESLFSFPSLELRKNIVWHVGNISSIDENSLYFRIGKTKKSKFSLYKETNFVDDEFETSPYTHVVLDPNLELCGIAKKPSLTPTPRGIANQLARLMNGSEFNNRYGAKIEIDDIKDPKDFLFHLKNAYSISKFWMTFKRPNPFDSEEHFIKPMEKLVKATNGHMGKTEISGENLNDEVLEDLSRSTAAAGNEAGARIKINEKSKTVTKLMKDNPVYVYEDKIEEKKELENLIRKIRQIYVEIRGHLKRD